MALRRITLKDFVIVPELELDTAAGFTVLTGETGAGKSILIDALQLAMGARADAALIRQGCSKTDVTAEFDAPPQALPLLEEMGMDGGTEGNILLRRSVDVQGRSRGWINGTPATATQLRQMGDVLVDIHGQHAWQNLMHGASMRQLLDGYGHIDTRPLGELWQQWQNARQRLEQAEHGRMQRQDELERLQWQSAEVEKLSPSADEWDQINAEQQRLAHAQQLLDAAQLAQGMLENEEGGALRHLQQAAQALQAHEDIEPEFVESAALIESCHLQLQEVHRQLHGYLHRIDLDPERLTLLDARIGQWLGLARRFQLPAQDLPARWAQWQARIVSLQEDEDIKDLQQAATQAEQDYLCQARSITQLRTSAAALLSREVGDMIQHLGMQGGSFAVSVEPAAQPGSSGMDAVDFLVAGHPGVTPRPLAKVASGGELSRLALAIAVATSRVGQAPTLIFDEVDAGIGGTVAHTVGALMRQLGHDRQVFAVTHLPQVAACAHHHVRIVKGPASGDAAGPGTTSQAVVLAPGERRHELARMLGSESAATTLAHADALLAQASATPGHFPIPSSGEDTDAG